MQKESPMLVMGYSDRNYSEQTVIRLQRKVLGDKEIYDLRLWGRTKEGKLYPRFAKGVSLNALGWSYAFEMFKENGWPILSTTNKKLEGQA